MGKETKLFNYSTVEMKGIWCSKFQQFTYRRKKKVKINVLDLFGSSIILSPIRIHMFTFKSSLDWSFFFFCCHFQSLSIKIVFYNWVIASQRPHVVFCMHSGICFSLSHVILESIFPKWTSMFFSSLSVLPFVFLILYQSKIIALES